MEQIADRPYGRLPGYFWPVLILLSALSVIPIWLVTYFPSHNGPSLLLITYMLKEFGNPANAFSSYFELHPFPVPYLLQTSVVYSLLSVFSPLVAEKIWLTLVIALRPLALIYLLRSLGRGRELYALACFAMLYDFSLMRGYTSYHIGISVGLIALGYYIRNRDTWVPSRVVAFNALLLLLYFTHIVALAVTGILMAAYEFALTRSPAKILGIVLRGFVPGLVLIAAFLYWSNLYGAWVSPDVHFNSLSDKIQNIFYRGATPVSLTANLISLGLFLFIGALATLRLVRAYGGAASNKLARFTTVLEDEPGISVFLAAVVLYLLMPWELVGWHKADVRIIPIIFMLILALPPATFDRRRQAILTSIIATAVVGHFLFVSVGVKAHSRQVEEYVAGVDAIERESKILPLFFWEKREGKLRLKDVFNPIQRADGYYAMSSGGASGRTLAYNNTLYWIWYKDYEKSPNFPEFPRVSVRNPTSEAIRTAAGTYDAVVLWNDQKGLQAAFENEGFEATFAQGRLAVLTRPLSP